MVLESFFYRILYIVVFIIKVLMEKELFVIYIKIFIDIESINGVFLEFLIFGFVCLKECLIFNLMMYGIREFQSFVVGGSVIRQKGYVFNVLVVEENFMFDDVVFNDEVLGFFCIICYQVKGQVFFQVYGVGDQGF